MTIPDLPIANISLPRNVRFCIERHSRNIWRPPVKFKAPAALRTSTEKRAPRPVEGLSSLHPNGRVRLLSDRRVSKRTRSGISVRITAAGRTQSAVLCDISRDGLGLRDVDHLTPGQTVAIEFDSDISVFGRVVWADDSRAGIHIIEAN